MSSSVIRWPFAQTMLNLHGWKQTWKCSAAESIGTRQSELHSWSQFTRIMRVWHHIQILHLWKTPTPQLLSLKGHIFLTPSSSSHLSLASSALPLKGLKPALGDAGLEGEAWPDRPREALRLRLLSRPRFLLLPSRLTRRRSLRPVGGGWLSSSPSSCCSVIWGKRKSLIDIWYRYWFDISWLPWFIFASTSMQMDNLWLC